MLVKDELDVLPWTLRHLAYHVDAVYVADNGSTDGTREMLAEVDLGVPLSVADDDEPGHWQSRKTTALAMEALAQGHSWVVPCDADEVWYVAGDPDRRVADYLAGQGPDVMIVEAELYHHLPTAADMPRRRQPNPFLRIAWRNRERGALPKVACRLRPDLTILDGNHGAATTGTALRVGGLCIRHFSWRTREQYLRKIRNGAAAFAATDLPADTGAHWRVWNGQPDEAIMEHFDQWFFSQNPLADGGLIRDPAPAKESP
jgi:hypothetical protein